MSIQAKELKNCIHNQELKLVTQDKGIKYQIFIRDFKIEYIEL